MVEPNNTIKEEIVISKGTLIRNKAYIQGPVIIGKNCDIGPNCFIRPSTAIGNNVHVGNVVELKNTILMDDTKVGHLSYVGDSVLGRRCNFGAGTKVANLRHDGKNVKVMVRGKSLTRAGEYSGSSWATTCIPGLIRASISALCWKRGE